MAQRPLKYLNRRIGKGAFGTVQLAEDEEWGIIAVKKVYIDDKNRDVAITEAKVLKYLTTTDCPWNIKLYDYYMDDEAQIMYYYMEYFKGYDLKDLWLNMSKPADLRKWQFLATELATAIICLHDHGIVHRDIKLENVMFDYHQLKLIDFGMSCLIDECPGKMHGTLSYWSPDLMRKQYERKNLIAGDLWALGILLYRLAYQRPLFTQSTAKQITAAVLSIKKLDDVKKYFPSAVELGRRRISPETAMIINATLFPLLDPTPEARIAAIAHE